MAPKPRRGISVADRLDHNVPIFCLQCDLQYELPLVPTTGGDNEPHDISDLDAARRDLESVQIPEPSEPSGRVSAPRASSKGGEEGDDRGEEERWIDELPPNHLMTHLPKSRVCDTCLQAKLYESAHRRRENQRAVLKEARGKEDPKEHLEKIAVDFAIASDLVGQTGDKAALVLVDNFFGLLGIYPCEDRGTEECMKGLQHFCGTKAPGVVEVASDREGGILKAVI